MGSPPVSPRRRRCGCSGRRGCTRARLIAALARGGFGLRSRERGRGLGWELEEASANQGSDSSSQRSPPRASRLGGGGDRRRPASSAPRAATAWGLQLPTGPAAGPGSERGRRARPENQPTPGALLRVPSDFHGDSRHFTKPGRLNALMHGSPGTATASPPPAGPHPRGWNNVLVASPRLLAAAGPALCRRG